MTTNGNENRAELLQRIELMETMIAEGRQSTMRRGWIFVLWGVLYTVAVMWTMYLPSLRNWAWPVCMIAGVVILNVVKARQKRTGGSGENPRSRSIEAVWKGMGIGITLYAVGAGLSHHGSQPACLAAILFFIGLAHAISAMILRWVAQGAAAAIWWVGGLAVFFVPASQYIVVFLAATFFGMILFGVYAMVLERGQRRSGGCAAQHLA